MSLCSNPLTRRLTTCKRATAISSSARCIPRGSTCSSKRRPNSRSPAENLYQDSGLLGMARRACKGFWCTRCWGYDGLRLPPTRKAADAPPWKSEDCATSTIMCGSLVPKAHRESPPRRENTGSGSRIHGSTQASGLDPHPQGYAGSGSVIVRRTSMNTCAVVKCSAMGSSFVRPKIGPYAIPRPASGPGASVRSYAGRPPEVNGYWSCGRGPITQRGEPPSS